MTVLEKPVVRLTKVTYKGKPIIVELLPHGVVAVRRYRVQERYTVPLESLFEVGAKIAFLEENAGKPLKLRRRRPIR